MDTRLAESLAIHLCRQPRRVQGTQFDDGSFTIQRSEAILLVPVHVVEIGVLGVQGRADTVEGLSEILRRGNVEPTRWCGVWLFVDWLEFSGARLDPTDSAQVAAQAAVELEASRRDPYRQLSRVFHLVGRKGPS